MRSRGKLIALGCSFVIIGALALVTFNNLESWPTALSHESQSSSAASDNESTATKQISSSNGSSGDIGSKPRPAVDSPSSVSNSAAAGEGLDTSCPLSYPRLTASQIKAGRVPYIYNGNITDCVLCKSQEREARFCRKDPDPHVCSKDLQKALLDGQLNEMHRSDILTFTPCDLWPHLRGRTVWFAGDGTHEDMFRALECFMYEFMASRNSTKNVWRHSINTTAAERTRLGIIGVGCTDFIENTRFCFFRCDVGLCMTNHVLPYLAVAAKTTDLFIPNFGLQFDPDYINHLSDFVEQLKIQQHKLPRVIWKDTVPTHYQSQLGDFVGGGHPFTCAPLAGGYSNLWHSPEGHLETWDPALHSLLYGGTRNRASSEMARAGKIPIISVYNLTVPLWQFHRDGQCTHYCFPSAPEVGVYGLYAMLKEQSALKSGGVAGHKAL